MQQLSRMNWKCFTVWAGVLDFRGKIPEQGLNSTNEWKKRLFFSLSCYCEEASTDICDISETVSLVLVINSAFPLTQCLLLLLFFWVCVCVGIYNHPPFLPHRVINFTRWCLWGGGSSSFDGSHFMFIFCSSSIKVHEWCPLKSDRQDSGISRVTACWKGVGGRK